MKFYFQDILRSFPFHNFSFFFFFFITQHVIEKNTDFGVRESQPGFECQALLLTSHVVMANVVNLPEPQFSL